MILKHTKTSEKLLLVKEMITQLVVCQIILISKKIVKMISINLSKQQALDADPRAVQEINFTGNLDREKGTFVSFIYE